MDYTGTYSSKFRLMLVNTETWADQELGPSVYSAEVSKDCTDDCSVLETGTYAVDFPIGQLFVPGWYRLEMLSSYNGEIERLPIATQYMQSTRGTFTRQWDQASLTGYSTLYPASGKLTVSGMHVPKGANGAEFVEDLLKRAVLAPVNVIGTGFTIDDHYVFDPGTSFLRAAWDVLSLADWCMQVDGYGEIYIMAKPTEPELTLADGTKKVIVPGISYEFDLSNVPNHYAAITSSGDIVEVMNEQDGSDTSIAARGGLIQDYVDLSPVPVNGEGLEGYVRRRLEEESTVYRKYSYTRSFVPSLLPYDIIQANLPREGLRGKLRILSQRLTCSHGIFVTETAAEEVKEYVA